MAKVNQQMFAPKHIRLGQSEKDNISFLQDKDIQSTPLVKSMTITERIFLANDKDIGPSSPREIIVDNQNLSHIRSFPVTLKSPPTLTVENVNYRTAADDMEERHISNKTTQVNNGTPPPKAPSPSIDQRVALLERQVTRLNSRVYQLSDDFESVQYFQKTVFCVGIVVISTLILKNVIKR